MISAREALKQMGIDPDEAIQTDQELQSKPRGDKRICMCGHSVQRHDMALDRPVCTVGKMYCPCRAIKPVIEVEDTRPFIRKTEGSAILHALSRGIAAAAEKGHNISWIEEALECDRCKVRGVRLVPVPVTANGVPQQHATGFDVLLCDDCRINR